MVGKTKYFLVLLCSRGMFRQNKKEENKIFMRRHVSSSALLTERYAVGRHSIL
jgi:hypothetical protein